jgi:hypothetical protein
MENDVQWLLQQLQTEQRLRDEWSDVLAAQLLEAIISNVQVEKVDQDIPLAQPEDQNMGGDDTFSTLHGGQVAEAGLETLLVNV